MLRKSAGSVVRELLPDGTVFTSFDGQQRPVAGTVAGQNGGPAQSVDITYDGAGGDTWSLQDQTRIVHNAAGGVGREELPVGTVFTSFDGQQRPVEGTVAGQDGGPAQAVNQAGGGGGEGTWSVPDHTRILQNTAGSVVRVDLPDWTVFTSFDGQQRPVEGTVAGQNGGPAQPVNIAYDGGGGDTWSLQDQTKIVHNATGGV